MNYPPSPGAWCLFLRETPQGAENPYPIRGYGFSTSGSGLQRQYLGWI